MIGIIHYQQEYIYYWRKNIRNQLKWAFTGFFQTHLSTVCQWGW